MVSLDVCACVCDCFEGREGVCKWGVAVGLLRGELRGDACGSITWDVCEDEYLNDRGTNMALLTMALKRMVQGRVSPIVGRVGGALLVKEYAQGGTLSGRLSASVALVRGAQNQLFSDSTPTQAF